MLGGEQVLVEVSPRALFDAECHTPEWERHIANVNASATRKLNLMRRVFSHQWGATRRVGIIMFKCWLRASLEFASDVWRTTCD